MEGGFATNPKVVGLSDGAFRAHVAAMCYCAHHGTDGLVVAPAARMFATAKQIGELVAAGLWERAGDPPNGYAIHDWAEYQPPSDNGHRRAANRERKRRWRESRQAGGT